MALSSGIQLVFIEPHRVAEWWPKVETFVVGVIESMRGKYTAEDMFTCAVQNKVQFWTGFDDEGVKLFGITQINQFPSCRICQVIAVTGQEREKWEHFMAEVERWAKYNGCSDMELVARPGWERIMKPHGFEKTHVVLNKYL